MRARIVRYGGMMALALMLSAGLSSCGGNPFKSDSEAVVLAGQDGPTLWESKLQYVRIVDRDMPGVANDHPYVISGDDLRTVLSSVYVSQRVLLQEKQVPLFSPGELQVLSTALASGLAQAESNEDVNFVIIGQHQGALAKERRTNSGRVFISGGRLNIIFGLVHDVYRELDPITNQPIDRRLNPLLPGTRKSDSEPSVRVALDNGQSYYIDPETGKERSDWIVLDIATVLATMAERAGQDTGDISPELIEDISRNKQETANLRDDVANIKEILFDMSDQIDGLKKQIEELKANQ